ncbi:unnamed protein product [Caenorhabditis auriculariae]|uniref:Uncharacterized protein n=1 Tax=Caenorhabditis auriculariae TaxID=2777116 RepID=A0A8S1GXC7_9PELO|nr:unnamed protein product [Caenorhabditis auriculariae]
MLILAGLFWLPVRIHQWHDINKDCEAAIRGYGRSLTDRGRLRPPAAHNMMCVPSAWLLAVGLAVVVAQDAAPKDCQSILANDGDQQDILLCQLSESSTLLAQLGALVSEGMERLIQNRGIALPEEPAAIDGSENGMEKRKHEYLRFGKRKHEYLRFGKRKHEYLRFGKRKHEYLRFGRK